MSYSSVFGTLGPSIIRLMSVYSDSYKLSIWLIYFLSKSILITLSYPLSNSALTQSPLEVLLRNAKIVRRPSDFNFLSILSK